MPFSNKMPLDSLLLVLYSILFQPSCKGLVLNFYLKTCLAFMSCMIRDYKLPFKKYWYAFEASMTIYVKSFEQHEIDPMLLNKTTSDFHEAFIRHCICSVAL